MRKMIIAILATAAAASPIAATSAEAQQQRQGFQGVPGDGLAVVDREVPERLGALARAGRTADADVLGAVHPFQGPERVLGGLGDR